LLGFWNAVALLNPFEPFSQFGVNHEVV
jgi:hypothetical protein